MGVHLVIIAKLKLLAGGHSNCQILASLLCPFALKLPFVAARLPNSCAQLAVSLRFFVFRLGRIFLQRWVGRWETAIRLLHDRVVTNEERRRVLSPTDEMLTQISMLTL
ncbi:hypothetical protein OPV22_002970 [Ensete ventricosum]|uniref:Secreted protein n=1 Tax=Ensete ventricosum TaxID=4639 RepID=A0AAV8RZG3_ENSVE|nr:hypothetical protein OPV22_002970 [Ensete ventricosum]RWW22654.1 hypothetical protein GW17_00013137 [Ensete ventricosum]RZS10975.1 hypothetical protein BHM03_00042258 [Ensete ventricosum]